MKIKSVICASIISLHLASVAFAQTVVNWGGNYIDINVPFSRDTTFSDTIPLNPTAPYAGTSSTFYGGAQLANTITGFKLNDSSIWTYATGVNGAMVAGVDRITFDWVGNYGGTTEGAVLWKKADFLGVDSSDTVVFDLSSTLSLNMPGSFVSIRFLVQDSGIYYVSSANTSTSGVFSLTDPNDNSEWTSYAPASNLDVNSSTAVFSPHLFTNVQAVGYYFEAKNLRMEGGL